MVRRPVPVIVAAQLFGTSLWFSVNSAADDLVRSWGITPSAIGDRRLVGVGSGRLADGPVDG
jgi:hypothetical protein